ncbi:MAG TPA: D-2-hydroxyacid dehydrogenase [Thermomicrobiales bacterium]|nr:D-2-hydroxyacid dehydrogenase [Thermomicrobiales bacterium]
MSGSEAAPNRMLKTLLIRFPLQDEHVQRLRDRFPDLDVAVAPNDADFLPLLPRADAIVGWGVSAEEIAAAPNLRWIQTVGAGVEDIIVPEMAARGIILTNNSGVHAPNIAEHLMAMILAFARRLPFQIRGQLAHEWRDTSGRQGLFELGGQTLLVVGLGDIGQALAQRALAFGMNVVGVRRRDRGPVEGVSEVVGLEALPRVLPNAHHVAICLPLTVQTRGLFDRATILRMRPGAFLYNIGRGPIVETTALVDSLESGHLGGAGLDVTDPEPLPADSPLWDMENVIITSHTSGATPRYWDRAIVVLESNIERFRSGAELLNVVDLDLRY